MIDTNQIIQAGQVAQEAKTQISPWLPALAIGFAWFGRELNHFLMWLDSGVERIIAHGGLVKIAKKLFWN